MGTTKISCVGGVAFLLCGSCAGFCLIRRWFVTWCFVFRGVLVGGMGCG